MYAKTQGRSLWVIVLINIALIVLILFMIDWAGIYPVRKFFSWVPFIGKAEPVAEEKIEESNKLKIEELKKTEQRLKNKEELLDKLEKDLKTKQVEIDNLQLQLKTKEDQLNDREKVLTLKIESEDNKEVGVQKMANRLVNMDPNASVNIMLGLDPFDVVDIFRQMEKDAEAAGSTSLVPYYLQLMEKTAIDKVIKDKDGKPKLEEGKIVTEKVIGRDFAQKITEYMVAYQPKKKEMNPQK